MKMKINDKFERVIQKGRNFLGKPINHWERMAEVELVEMLLGNLRMGYTNPDRLPGYINRKRVLDFLAMCDQEVVAEVLAKYDRMAEGFAAILADMQDQSLFRNALESARMPTGD